MHQRPVDKLEMKQPVEAEAAKIDGPDSTAVANITQAILARLLTKRGILSMRGASGVGSGTYAKILVIRPDALEAFAKVHLDETGLSLATANI